MTIAGISLIVATSVLAAIGDVDLFRSPAKLASYLGLTPRVRQSGDRPATHGRITKCGNSIARHMLVEAARSASKTPGPLRSFFRRVQTKSGGPVAAVATARKMATLIWHMLTKQTDCAWARPRVRCHETPEARAQSWRCQGPWQGWTGTRLLDQGDPTPRGGTDGARGGSLCP
jgi:transposase